MRVNVLKCLPNICVLLLVLLPYLIAQCWSWIIANYLNFTLCILPKSEVQGPYFI
jgi:hypothetical protein